jgi:hypothetical protein
VRDVVAQARMRSLSLLLVCLLTPGLAAAKVLNVEFKFTPYTGDTQQDKVESVPGRVTVTLNGVPIAAQTVEKQELPVMFDDREIAPSAWVTTEGLGSMLRKGTNTIRFEFAPAAPGDYHAQLRWAEVTDQVHEAKGAGSHKSTNQAGEGVDEKTLSGPLVMERKFEAPFATDQPWHHLPPVTSVSDEDRAALTTKVAERVEWFKPDFSAIYKTLAATPNVRIDEIRKRKCVEAAHKAGVKIAAVPPSQMEIVTTGGPEVVVKAKQGELYQPTEGGLDKIKGKEMQMCAGMALMAVYPPRLVAVRTPNGNWEIVN